MTISTSKELSYVDTIYTILIIAFVLTMISLEVDFGSRLHTLLRKHTELPVFRFSLNFSFLLLAGFLLMFYRRWSAAEKRKTELQIIIDSINPSILMTLDTESKITMCSRSIAKILGFEPEEVVADNFESLLSGDRTGWDHSLLEKIRQNDFHVGEIVARKNNGDPIDLEIIAGRFREGDGSVLLLRDITARKKDKEAIHIQKQAIENMQMGVTITDKKGTIIYTNPADAEMHGYLQRELIGKDVRIFALSDQCNPLSERDLKCLKRFRRESMNVRKDGTTFPVQLMSDVVTNIRGDIIGVITTCEDISERRKSESLIQHLAYYDTLTGLPNRSLFSDMLKKELAKSRRHGQSFAVFFIDLDRFKIINDTFGHAKGDLLLSTVATRLKNATRESDTVGRLGGDEFIILIPDVEETHKISVIADKIINKLKEEYILDSTEFYVTASIGISMFPSNGQTAEVLIKNADIAMYQAKERGGNTYQFYNDPSDGRTINKLSLESSLRKAIERTELTLHYQPQIDLYTSRVVACEALLRWNHKALGYIHPKEIVTLAEETELIFPLGRWLFHTACSQIKTVQNSGFPFFRISVNVSMKQFWQKTFARELIDVIDRSGVSPDCLELELTESVLMRDKDFTASALRELKSAGVSIAVDDFGTGYSSLSYLKNLPLDKIKIDKSFIETITDNRNDRSIVEAIIIMAHCLNLKVVAEGVESPQQLELLQSLQCDEVQGFIYSRPLPGEDLTDYLLGTVKETTGTVMPMIPSASLA